MSSILRRIKRYRRSANRRPRGRTAVLPLAA
jgi:hypothetical protein